MSRATADDQLRFLLSCVKHSNNGKIDFSEVASECGIVSKGAAAKRYERLMKANGIHPNSDKPIVSPVPRERSKAAILKAAALKRRKIEDNEYDIKEDEGDDLDSFQTKREPVDYSSLKSIIGVQQPGLGSSSTTMPLPFPYSRTIQSTVQLPDYHQSFAPVLPSPQLSSSHYTLQRPHEYISKQYFQSYPAQGVMNVPFECSISASSPLLQSSSTSSNNSSVEHDSIHHDACSEGLFQNLGEGCSMQEAQPISMTTPRSPFYPLLGHDRTSTPTIPPCPQEVIPQDEHMTAPQLLVKSSEPTGRDLEDSILIAD